MYPTITDCTQDNDTLPVSLEEAGSQCRLSNAEIVDAETSASLTAYIMAAQSYLENNYNLSITSKTFESLFYGRSNGDSRLYLKPHVSEVLSVTVNGVAFTGWELRKGASVTFLDCTRSFTNVDRIKVSFKAGFDDVSNIPHNIKQALRLLISHWNDNRNPEITGTIVARFSITIDALMSNYKGIPVA